MNQALIAQLEHHADRAAAGAPFNALDDCHALGLTSIVLHDEPGNRMRIFAAQRHHQLYFNLPNKTLTVAIHPHHCAIRLVGLFGRVRNDVYALTPCKTGTHQKFRYRSAITAGSGALEPTGEFAMVERLRSELLEGNAVALDAHVLHTVYVPEGQAAAWLVLEGAEDPNYESVCWTNADGFDSTGFYSPVERVPFYLRAIARRMLRGRDDPNEIF